MRLFLLVAAAEPVGDPLLVWRAAERLGIDSAAADSAEKDGMLASGAELSALSRSSQCLSAS